MHSIKLGIIAIGFLVGFFPVQNDWELQKFEQGIAVYTRIAENSKFKELKSVAQYKASLSAMVALINDRPSYTKWVYRCGESEILKRISDTELMHHQTVVAPWPADNRDFVVNVKLTQDLKTKVITINSTCKPDYIPHKKNHVRITEFRAKWILTLLPGGYVNVEYQLLVNPGGNVPAWLVNMAVIDGPFETGVNMREWIKKEVYQKAKLSYIVD